MNQGKTISNIKTENTLSSTETAVLCCLLYFDTFNYPLSFDEIYSFCTIKIANESILESTLNDLLNKNLVHKKDLFYFISEDDKLVERRIKGNKFAHQVMPKALKYGRFISKFPFVDAVCISGSLSKNYFDENADVDFFIVTKPERLWLCRSLLVGFKKVFLLNSRKYFCVNYFVSNDNLTIPDQNIFTATEIASLIPVNNQIEYTRFIAQNKWIYGLLPNFDFKIKTTAFPINENKIKKTIERILDKGLGDFADKQLFKLTLKIWQNKFKHFDKNDFDLNMRSRKNVSKHHPSGFQQKVLKNWQLSKEQFCNKHKLNFFE